MRWTAWCAGLGLFPVGVVALACGDAAPGGDAGAPDASVADAGNPPLPPAAPAEPALPVLTPCPPGWRELPAEDGVAVCDPWPAGDAEGCPPEEAHFPGQAGCTTIGSPCPAGDYAESLPPAARILHVRAGAAPGGDGSVAAPYATVTSALAAAADGDVVALSRGTFDEAVSLPAGVTLWGACPAETRLAPSTFDAMLPALNATRPGGVVKNITIAGERGGVSVAGAGSSLELVDVLLDGTRSIALNVTRGGILRGNGVVVRGTRPAPDGRYGNGAIVIGARLELTRTVIERSLGVGFAAARDGTVVLDGVAIRVVDFQHDGAARAVVLQGGGHAEIRRSIVEQSAELNVFADGDGSTLVMEDAVIRGPPDGAARPMGAGLAVQGGASSELRRILFERISAHALKLGRGSHTAEDVVARRLPADRDAVSSLALSAYSGAELRLTRMLVAGDQWFGGLVTNGGTLATISDLTMRTTGGAGFNVLDEAHLDAERVRLVEPYALGILVGRFTAGGATAALRDLVIRDPLLAEDGRFGHGLSVVDGDEVVVERMRVERPAGGGVLVAGPTSVARISDLVVMDTGGEGSGLFGRGVTTQRGARTELARVLIERARDLGLDAWDEGTVMTGTDVAVVETLPRACAASTCAMFPSGIGIGAYESGALELTRFRIETASMAGIQVARGGAIDLHDGEVRMNPVGANVQVPGFDIARLANTVLYIDNAVDLDSTGLPVPDAAIAPTL